jgi:hypothetical protein
MLRYSPESTGVGKIWLSEPCIYIDITINLDISYETDNIIYVVLSKLCSKQSNIVVEAHIQSSNPYGGVCRNIVPNILKRP